MKPDLDAIQYQNHEEFMVIKDEIFNKEIYRFSAESDSPLIIDAGAHIGLASIYFKTLYPQSRIIAFEPNPISFKILQHNLASYNSSEITIYNLALASREGKRDFYIDSSEKGWDSTAGFLDGTWMGTFKSKKIDVMAVQLSKYIKEPVDLIKLDIEGAELKVLEEIENKLQFVKKFFIESHPISDNHHSKILKLLKKNSFAIKMWRENYEITEPLKNELIIIEATSIS